MTVLAALTLALSALPGMGRAQSVQELDLTGVPPDMISPDAPSGQASGQTSGDAPLAQVVQTRPVPVARGQSAATSTGTASVLAPVSLGQTPGGASDASGAFGGAAEPSPASAGGVTGTATQAAQAARASAGGKGARLRRAVAPEDAGPVERAVFERAPVRVPLPVGRERMVTLPTAAALHVPADMERVARVQNIDRTLYVTALVPFTPIRVVAELLDSGQQIPMDWTAGAATAASTGELQVSVLDPRGAANSAGNGPDGGGAGSPAPASAATAQASGTQTEGLDLVELTRFAVRQLYAPERLAVPVAGVAQIGVAQTPLPGLIRGMDAEIVPQGQWKSGPLYVTAVRVTNRSRYPQEIALEQLRGNWIAATAQHARIGPAGSLTDTTAIYLICARRFDACLQ